MTPSAIGNVCSVPSVTLLESSHAVGEEMPDFTSTSHPLADLLEAHYGEPIEEPTPPGLHEARPPFRLGDWQLLDEISVGSREYLLLRRVSSSSNEFDSLTVRELEAVRRASSGASNREVARLMGISASTVGVLLARASRKVGAAGRDGLIHRFNRQRRSTRSG
jgi:DNA-binding CsgD family transcriptional regulator